MKIAIDTADLDCERIDGTRVYIQNVLKYLGELAPEDEFFLLHKMEYNKLLKLANFDNYQDKSLGKGFWWTQIKFARAVRKLRPVVCWMPIQQIPGLNFQFSIFNFQSIFNVLIFKFKLVFSGGKVKFRKANVSSDLKTPQNSHSSNFDPLYLTSPNRLRGTGAGGGIKYVVTIHDLAFKGRLFPLLSFRQFFLLLPTTFQKNLKNKPYLFNFFEGVSAKIKKNSSKMRSGNNLFPDHFPLLDRIKLNWYTDVAVRRADRIIAISEATKRDLIRLYPGVDHAKISVVHHGFDRENFEQEFSEEEKVQFLKKWKLNCSGDNNLKPPQNFRSSNFDSLYPASAGHGTGGGYLLYVGAIQPRKDLITLIRAFNKLKSQETKYKLQDTRYKIQTNSKTQDTRYKQKTRNKTQEVNSSLNLDGDVSGLKLVLVGERAWKSEETIRAVENSEFKDDIIVTGKVDFKELAMFYRWAKVFVFPSLYEGFGIPILEAMASKTPVIVADNSSLLEVGGEAVLKFKTGDSDDLEKQLQKLLGNKDLQDKIVEQGLEQLKKFSWEKCARETLKVLKKSR